jgi:Tol biopolymer transport system component
MHVGSDRVRRTVWLSLVLLAAGSLAAGCFSESEPAVPPYDADRPPNDQSPIWSPDGERLAFVRGDEHTLRVIDVRSGRIVVVSDGLPSGWGRDYVWSSDGNRIAFVRAEDRTLRLADLRSGRTTELLDGVSGLASAPWSPDGRFLAVTSDRDGVRSKRCLRTDGMCVELYAVPVAGGPARRLTVNETYEREPVWSPDSRRLAFLSGHEPGDPRAWRDVRVVDLEHGTTRFVTNDSRGEWNVQWDPGDGELVIDIDDGSRAKLVLGPPIRRRDLPRAKYTPGRVQSPLDGTVAYTSTRDRYGRTCWADNYGNTDCAPNDELYLHLANGRRVRVTHTRVNESDLTWSPDGTTPAFISGGQIWLVDADGHGLRRLTG